MKLEITYNKALMLASILILSIFLSLFLKRVYDYYIFVMRPINGIVQEIRVFGPKKEVEIKINNYWQYSWYFHRELVKTLKVNDSLVKPAKKSEFWIYRVRNNKYEFEKKINVSY